MKYNSCWTLEGYLPTVYIPIFHVYPNRSLENSGNNYYELKFIFSRSLNDNFIRTVHAIRKDMGYIGSVGRFKVKSYMIGKLIHYWELQEATISGHTLMSANLASLNIAYKNYELLGTHETISNSVG